LAAVPEWLDTEEGREIQDRVWRDLKEVLEKMGHKVEI
jgi:hypothetical protein